MGLCPQSTQSNPQYWHLGCMAYETIRETRAWREELKRIFFSGYISDAMFKGQKYKPLSDFFTAQTVVEKNEKEGTQCL